MVWALGNMEKTRVYRQVLVRLVETTAYSLCMVTICFNLDCASLGAINVRVQKILFTALGLYTLPFSCTNMIIRFSLILIYSINVIRL